MKRRSEEKPGFFSQILICTKITEIWGLRKRKSLVLTRSGMFLKPNASIFRKFVPMRTYGKRFFIGWILCAIVMFGLSYLWHGVFLYDYDLITYNKAIYFTAASIAYIFIAFMVNRAFLIPWFDKISRHPLLRGPAVGFACGVLVYIVATVVHVTFNKDMDLKYLILDITWQGIEQAFGGFVVGLVYMLVYEAQGYRQVEEMD